MRSRLWLGGAAAALWAFAACGYPEFHYSDEIGSGPSSGKSTGATASGMSGTVSTGASGTGGGAPACELGKSGGACKSTEKCSWDVKTGKTKCVTAGPFGQWHVCTADADCAAGLWCDLQFKVCKKICQGAGNCTGGGQCIPALDAASQQVAPGPDDFKLCTANCNPKSAKPPCVDQTTCVLRKASGGFDCAAVTASKPAGQKCATSTDCLPGIACIDQGLGLTCTEWCTDFKNSNDCPNITTYCCHFGNKPSQNGTELGYCGFC